jgi:cell division protein FtsX
MNLATARSERRAREVGIRKTVGSRRIELIRQFLGEAILLTAFAFAFAILLTEISLPLFNDLVGKELFLNYQSPLFWLASLGFILTIGTVSGSYPAFYLSSFNPVKVLKGNLNVGRGSVAPRRVLVSLQFFFSIFLMVGMAVIVLQIQHVKARDIGYSTENLVMTGANEEMVKNFPEIEKQLLASGAVESMTVSSSPVTDIHRDGKLSWPGKYDGYEISFSGVMTGYNYTKTLGIEIESGRDFSPEFPADSSAMLLNHAAVEVMGVQDPIGMEVQILPEKKKWRVVGVIDDVVMKSPFNEVQPGFFLCVPRWIDAITIRLAPSKDLNESIATVKTIFNKLNPSDPFEFQFVNDEFDRKFDQINMVGTLVALFAFLALFITSLGLLGLATFMAEQRTKEIGIRKIMGASTASIITLMSKDFTRLVLTGFILAAPVSWWAVSSYLERFTYRINFSWWIIPTAGLLALMLTVIIVGAQARRVATGNLTESLRSE